jgi:ABC-type glutathione transport system ATPase component
MTGATSPAATSVKTVLRVEGVRKTFETGPPWHRRRLEVLRGASLEVAAGELVGLVCGRPSVRAGAVASAHGR